MDASMEKLCQFRDRGCRYAYRTTSQKSLNNIEKIQPRMMVATFDSNPSATIIFCYSPPNFREETDLIAFYNELSSLVHSTPKRNVQIIGGDMNSQIVQNVNQKFSQHNLSNRNGQHLTDFMLENRLRCLNTKFQKSCGETMDPHLRR